jgi:hypothetical protein
MRRSSLALPCLALVAVLFTACRKDEIVTYRLVKDPAPAAAPAASPGTPSSAPMAPATPADDKAAMANTAVTTASGPGLAWDAPANWTAGPERPMRKATFLIASESGAPGAELAITAFPGDVGGNLANVNRWRQQLSLAPISEAELRNSLQHLDVGALHVDVIKLVGPATPPAAPQGVLGALVPYQGSTWFFKLTGTDAVVTREQPAFLAFLRTLRPAN